MLGHGSPLAGVVVGPLRMTWHFLSSSRVSSGMAFMTSTRLSMVSPSICLSSTVPASISSARRNSMTFWADAQMYGPMPSPPHTPMMSLSSLE